jgi:hypothetical protein
MLFEVRGSRGAVLKRGREESLKLINLPEELEEQLGIKCLLCCLPAPQNCGGLPVPGFMYRRYNT